MKKVLFPIALAASLLTGTVMADDCYDPINTWQPQENLIQSLESNGWRVDRIKVDDGCYEVKGVDSLGNRFEAVFSPASLDIKELDIKFNQGGNAKDYLDRRSITE